MRITETRRFAEALGSWMHFETCCLRAGLFSESSFKSAIGSVASSLRAEHRGARVHADYPLHSIQRIPDADQKIGRGRKRSVDFALIYDDSRQPPSEPQLLIEAKWAGSSHCTVKNIMGDFIRLCLMKRFHPNAVCLLVLAGHKKDVGKALSRRPFVGGAKDLIRSDGTGTIKKFRFLPEDPDHQRHFSSAIRVFHEANLGVPTAFCTSGSLPYPSAPTTFRAVAWEVHTVESQNLNRDKWLTSKVKRATALKEDAIS